MQILKLNNSPKLETITNLEYFSCLMDAYNHANEEETNSPQGQYGWSIEKWSARFNFFFGVCQVLEQSPSE